MHDVPISLYICKAALWINVEITERKRHYQGRPATYLQPIPTLMSHPNLLPCSFQVAPTCVEKGLNSFEIKTAIRVLLLA
jgi:hypothetical protein